MGLRAKAAQVVSDLFGYASVVAASLGASSSAELTISANEDDASGDTCELWGHSPLLYKPLADSEALYATLGSERVVLATKDRRYQISVADGEVVVRAVGAASPAYVRLKPNGDAVIVSTRTFIGAASAAQPIPLGTALKTWLEAHTHPTSMGPSGVPVQASTLPNTLSTKHKVDS